MDYKADLGPSDLKVIRYGTCFLSYVCEVVVHVLCMTGTSRIVRIPRNSRIPRTTGGSMQGRGRGREGAKFL